MRGQIILEVKRDGGVEKSDCYCHYDGRFSRSGFDMMWFLRCVIDVQRALLMVEVSYPGLYLVADHMLSVEKRRSEGGVKLQA